MLIHFEYDNLHEGILLTPVGFNDSEWNNFVRIISDYSDLFFMMRKHYFCHSVPF